MQWLRQRKVKTLHDFKDECEQKWRHDDQTKDLFAKSDDEA